MKSLIVILVLVASCEAQLSNSGDLLSPLSDLLSTTLRDVSNLIVNLIPGMESLLTVVSDVVNVLIFLLRSLGLVGGRSKRAVTDCHAYLAALNGVYNQTLTALSVCKRIITSQTEFTRNVLLDARTRGNVVIEKTRIKMNTCGTRSNSTSCLYNAFSVGLNETQSLVIVIRAQRQKYIAARIDTYACITKIQDDAITLANVNYQNAVQCYYGTNVQTNTTSPRSL